MMGDGNLKNTVDEMMAWSDRNWESLNSRDKDAIYKMNRIVNDPSEDPETREYYSMALKRLPQIPSQRQLPPTTETSQPTSVRYEGRIENWQERFPEDRIVHYRDGASGGIYKGYDTLENRIVGIKELKGSKEGVDLEFLQTGDMQIRNIRNVIDALGKSQHPGL